MLLIILSLTLSVAALIVSVWLFTFSVPSFKLNELSLPSIVFYKSLIISTFTGGVLVSVNLDILLQTEFWAISNTVDQNIRFKGLLAILYFIVALPLGMIVTNAVLCRKLNAASVTCKFLKQQCVTQCTKHDMSVAYLSAIVLVVVAASVTYVYNAVGVPPLLQVLNGQDPLSLAIARGDAKFRFEGNSHVKDLIMLPLAPLTSCILFAYQLIVPRSIFRILFAISAILTVVALTYNLEKGPLINYLLMLMLCYLLVKRQVSTRKVLAFAACCALIIFGMFSVLMQDGSALSTIVAVVHRIFVAQVAGIYLSLYYFPDFYAFMGGGSISRSFAQLTGASEIVFYGRKLFELYNPGAFDAGNAGAIVSAAIAEGWIRFGLIGILLAPLYVGAFVQAVNLGLSHRPKTPIMVGAYAFLALSLPVEGELAFFMYPVRMLIVVFGVAFLIVGSIILQNLAGSSRKD
jgi:hypothetical protein